MKEGVACGAILHLGLSTEYNDVLYVGGCALLEIEDVVRLGMQCNTVQNNRSFWKEWKFTDCKLELTQDAIRVV